MYDAKGSCRMCGAGDDGSGWRDHAADCPGDVIERMAYEVTYEGPHCGSGCCGRTDGAAVGGTLEACVAEATTRLAEAVRFYCEARLVFVLEGVDATGLVSAERDRRKAERDARLAAELAAAEAAQAQRRRHKALADLHAMRADLTPEAFERRLRELKGSSS